MGRYLLQFLFLACVAGSQLRPGLCTGCSLGWIQEGRLENDTPKEEATQQNYTMTQLVQRAVNVARRADQRHKKAALDLQQCQQKWAKYQAQLKELFLKQQDAFLKDQDALEAELHRTKEAAEQAELKLKHVLEAKGEDEAMECIMEGEVDKVDPWEQLIGGVNVETGNAYTDQQIAHALQPLLQSGKLKAPNVDASSASAATAMSTMATTTPRTPSTRTTGGMPVTPTKGTGPPRVPTIPTAPSAAMRPFYNAKGNSVMDPYLLSPSATSLPQQGGSGGLTTSPLQRPIAQNLDSTRPAKQRTPIKEVGRQPTPRPPTLGPGREEQLQAKRAAAMQAMQDTTFSTAREPGECGHLRGRRRRRACGDGDPCCGGTGAAEYGVVTAWLEAACAQSTGQSGADCAEQPWFFSACRRHLCFRPDPHGGLQGTRDVWEHPGGSFVQGQCLDRLHYTATAGRAAAEPCCGSSSACRRQILFHGQQMVGFLNGPFIGKDVCCLGELRPCPFSRCAISTGCFPVCSFFQWELLDFVPANWSVPMAPLFYCAICGHLIPDALVQYCFARSFLLPLLREWPLSSFVLLVFESGCPITRDDATFRVGTDGSMGDIVSHWQAAISFGGGLLLTRAPLNSPRSPLHFPESDIAGVTCSKLWSSTFLDDAISTMGTDGTSGYILSLPNQVSSVFSACRRQWRCWHVCSVLDVVMCHKCSDAPLPCGVGIGIENPLRLGSSPLDGIDIAPSLQPDRRDYAWVFEYLTEQLIAASLTLLGIMAMSLLRLLLFACRLKGGRCNADPLIRGGRALTKGAPIRFWCILAVIYSNGFSHAEAMRRGTSASSNDFHAADTADFSADFRRLDVQIENAMLRREEVADMWYGPRIFPARVIPLPPLLVDDQGEDDQAEVPAVAPAEVRVPIRVMRVQHVDHYTSIWIAPGASTEEVMARANETVLLGSDHFYLVEVYPQPDDQVILTILIPCWWRRTVFTAVAIDPTECGQPVYAAMMPNTAFYGDVRRATSPLSPSTDGIHVIFENSLRQLIRIVLSGRQKDHSSASSRAPGSRNRLSTSTLHYKTLTGSTTSIPLACPGLRGLMVRCWLVLKIIHSS